MATLTSSKDLYKHTDYLIEDSSYRVVSGGLWRSRTTVDPIEKAINSILERHENQTQELERRMVLHTGPEEEEIRNSQSISTTRHFETEEEAINYLDSLSNDI